MSDAHASPMGYVKIWAILLFLLVLSILGPMLGNPVLTMITAFGIAFVKALMVAAFFMHLNVEKKIVWYILSAMILMVTLFFFATAPDVMKSVGQHWKNSAALELIEKHAGEKPTHAGAGEKAIH
jgi:caa(3)-type oxidase subunit IV